MIFHHCDLPAEDKEGLVVSSMLDGVKSTLIVVVSLSPVLGVVMGIRGVPLGGTGVVLITSWATKIGFRGDGFCGICETAEFPDSFLGSLKGTWGNVSEVHKDPAEPSKNQGGNFLVVVPPEFPCWEEQA